MGDVLVRVVIVAAILLFGLAAACAAGRFRQPVHPLVDLRTAGLDDRVVLFSSTDCRNCAIARSSLQRAGIPFREVTWELEGALLDRLGIEAVPLIVFRDPAGATVAQVAGAPRRGALRRVRKHSSG